MWYATVSGLSEPLAALVGVIFVRAALAAAPFALGFAAGAMLYVTSDELIPESHSYGYQTEATLAFACGFALFLIWVAAVAPGSAHGVDGPTDDPGTGRRLQLWAKQSPPVHG